MQSFNKARGRLHLTYALNAKAEQTFSLFQQQPLRLLFPHMQEIDIPAAVLINTSGGVVGGDEYKINIEMGKATHALITSQAAEKIYGSPSIPANIQTQIKVADHSWFEWIPQETILFNEARLKRQLSFQVAASSAVMAGEILIFGRGSRGEVFSKGLLRDEWSIEFDQEWIWQDILYLQEDTTFTALKHPTGFNQATAYATWIYIANDAHRQLHTAKAFLKQSKTKQHTTAFNHLLIVRWLSSDPFQLRQDFARFWGFWRHRQRGLSEALPRIWSF